MSKFLFILPVPLPKEAINNFAQQLPEEIRGAGPCIDFVGTRGGTGLMESPYESTIANAMVLDAGCRAQEDGYSAVCSFSTSDSGVTALRSRLSIPVVGAGQSSFLLAAQLGKKFSVITMWEPWAHHAVEGVEKSGLKGSLASVRHIDTRPDTSELLSGKEDVVFKKLEEQARLAIAEDGAEVIVVGSTTMYQSCDYLTDVLPCPVINPGVTAYKMCKTLVEMNLSQSRITYPEATVVNDQFFHPITPEFSA